MPTKTQIEKACERAKEFARQGLSYGLAIHKAAEETGVPVAAITAEFLHRRKASKEAKAKREAYRSTVRPWDKGEA